MFGESKMSDEVYISVQPEEYWLRELRVAEPAASPYEDSFHGL